MAQFIKLGAAYINLDNVRMVAEGIGGEDEHPVLSVCFSESDWVDLEDIDYLALGAYLDMVATDVPEWFADKLRGGVANKPARQ